jgi:hypothetical protein
VQYTAWVGWTLLDANDVLGFTMAPSGMNVIALEGNGGRLVEYTAWVGWSLLATDVQTWWRSQGIYGPDTIYVQESDGTVVELPL